MAKHKENNNINLMTMPVLKGTVIGLIVTFIIIFICAFIFTLRDISESAATPMSGCAVGIGALIGGFVASKSHKKQGLMIGAATGVALFLIMLLVSLFVSKGGFTVATPIRLLISVTAAAIGGILGVNMGKKRKMI